MIREFAVKLDGNNIKIINYPLNHVSKYIFTEIHSFLNEGKSNLPNIFDSYLSHSVLFDFIEKNKLTLNNYCQFFTSNESDYKFGVAFSKEKNEGSFKIINTMRGKYKDKTMARSVTASAFFNNTPIFKELTKNHQRNRFRPWNKSLYSSIWYTVRRFLATRYKNKH